MSNVLLVTLTMVSMENPITNCFTCFFRTERNCFHQPVLPHISIGYTEKTIIGLPTPNPSHIYILLCYYVNAYYVCKYVD